MQQPEISIHPLIGRLLLFDFSSNICLHKLQEKRRKIHLTPSYSNYSYRSSKGVNKVQIIRQSSKNPLKPRLSQHPLNTAMAHEKYFYHLSKPLEFTDFP